MMLNKKWPVWVCLFVCQTILEYFKITTILIYQTEFNVIYICVYLYGCVCVCVCVCVCLTVIQQKQLILEPYT